jgi:hypothetical protein
MKKLFYTISIIFLILVSCNEVPTVVPISPELMITLPINNSVVKEFNNILIKIETNLSTSVNKIELFGKYFDLYSDTLLIAEFNHPPYEKNLYIDISCVETDTLTLFAKATFNSNEIIFSSKVSIIINKIMPPDDSLEIYDYQGFNMDSNLVAKGNFSFYLKDNRYIYGRKNITAVMIDSAFEKGVGFIDGQKYNSYTGEYHIMMNFCDPKFFIGGARFIYIDGTMDGNKFYGGRYLGSFGPEHIKVGTFTAIKRE